jgi:hypothetical protein
MSNTRKKLKRTAGKTAKPRKGKAPFITSAEARRRAEQHVLNRMFKGALVRDGATAGHNAYNVRREDTWVVYKNLPMPGLGTSEIVVVCKRTGRVLYEGPASDENATNSIYAIPAVAPITRESNPVFSLRIASLKHRINRII